MDAIARDQGLGGPLSRLQTLWERTGDRGLAQVIDHRSPVDGQPVQGPRLRDWTSTALMDCYRRTGDGQSFALLFELNEAPFRLAVRARLRRTVSNVDPDDVVQEVFMNIYRYPHKFVADRADAFRSWGHRIAQNTLLKALKREARRAQRTSLDEQIETRADTDVITPERSAVDAEAASIVDRAYLLYLNLYLLHFERLSTRERRALTLVECEAVSYKDAAADLGIKLENLKMVIFRGRRKIFRGMSRTLSELDSLVVPVPSSRRGVTMAAPAAAPL